MSEERKQLELGDLVVDQVTKFSGVVTAICDNLGGCRQVKIETAEQLLGSGEKKQLDGRWFDEGRVIRPKL